MAEFVHKYDEVCPSGVIINFAVDVLGQSRGPVACVLMNVAEVTIFHHELRKPTQAFPADRIAVLADPNSFWADRDGKLWLMTYPQLSGILAASPGHLEEDLALLLHMGCGRYTWDIVKACHDLWRWGQNVEVGLGKPILRVFTISNLKESIYRDAPTTHLSTSWMKGPRLERLEPDAFGPVIAQVQEEFSAHIELCKSIREAQNSQKESQESDSGDENLQIVQQPLKLPNYTNRAVVFTSKDKLLDAYDRHGCPPLGYSQASGGALGHSLNEWVEVLLQRRRDRKTILVEPDVGTIGTVRNLGTVLVLPVRKGLFFDRRVSQVVWRENTPISKTEVRYACRVACSPVGSVESHAVSVFATVAGLNKLPPTPTDAPAFTGDFPATLLHFCDHSYLDGGDNVSPIRFPKDKKMTNEYLRRLEARGLTESHGGPLTGLGRLTLWWYHSRVRNFDVANLLAIASTTQGARASALVQIAAVIYHPDSPLMSPISSFLRFQIPEGRLAEFHSLLEKSGEVNDFAQNYLERGPIWIAVAMWAGQRRHRSPQDLALAKDFSVCEGMLQVSPRTLGMIESNWMAMSQASSLNGAQIDEKPPISEEDFLFLEESIVRVWMHNLVFVNTSNSELGVFACDLLSGSNLTRPVINPVNWVRLVEEVDSEPPEGQPYVGVFAVYTALHRLKGSDGKAQYVPEDLTFVSTRAVRRVLRAVAISKRREGYPTPSWHDVLRTRYPICHDPGDP